MRKKPWHWCYWFLSEIVFYHCTSILASLFLWCSQRRGLQEWEKKTLKGWIIMHYLGEGFNHLLGWEKAILVSFTKKLTNRNWNLARNLKDIGVFFFFNRSYISFGLCKWVRAKQSGINQNCAFQMITLLAQGKEAKANLPSEPANLAFFVNNKYSLV